MALATHETGPTTSSVRQSLEHRQFVPHIQNGDTKLRLKRNLDLDTDPAREDL
jgi:hypothetical protein